MSTELSTYSYDQTALTVERKPRSQDYQISVFGCPPTTLRRGVDFGMVRKKNGDPMTKQPTLFKSGAEKVAVAYGLCQRYTIESKIEAPENGFFYFCVRCDLVKIVLRLGVCHHFQLWKRKYTGGAYWNTIPLRWGKLRAEDGSEAGVGICGAVTWVYVRLLHARYRKRYRGRRCVFWEWRSERPYHWQADHLLLCCRRPQGPYQVRSQGISGKARIQKCERDPFRGI